jgi:hypothetical protein
MNREAVLNTLIMDQQKRFDREERRVFQLDELYEKYRDELDGLKKFRETTASV